MNIYLLKGRIRKLFSEMWYVFRSCPVCVSPWRGLSIHSYYVYRLQINWEIWKKKKSLLLKSQCSLRNWNLVGEGMSLPPPCVLPSSVACKWFLPLSVASCCIFIQLVLYDAVNRNKVSIHWLPLISFFTHYMFRPLRAILRWDIQLVIWMAILIQRICWTYAIWYRDDICRHRYFNL
jgi:hypothetical protein